MYPDRNPFPPQAITTIEGIDWEAFLREPTFERPSMLRVLAVLMRYKEGHQFERVGRALAIHGEHGTGKTHCTAYALAKMWSTERSESHKPIILYARADNTDELALYRRLVARLSITEFRELVSQSFAGYAAEAFDRERSSSVAQQETVSVALHDDPSLVLSAVADREISLSGILDLQEKDMERVQGRVGNFERALRDLYNPELSKLAHRWIVGQELSSSELKMLGVQGNLADPADVRTAVHVLAAVARRAGRCLYVALDQAEAFLVDDSNRLSKRAAGFLRSLLEVVVKEGGCFAASMNNETWSSIPRDLRQRFGPAEITMQALTLAEAQSMIAAYLAPWRKGEGDDTAPFQADAIEQLLVLSGGNARRFLQAAYLAFQRALIGRRSVDKNLVIDEVRRDFASTSPTESDVRTEIAHSLRRVGADFTTEANIGGRRVDFAVMVDDRPIVLVEVTRPVFAMDEAEQAVRNLDLIREAKARGASAILVVVGYSSPDVVERLKKAAERVVVADGADYSAKVAVAIDEELRHRQVTRPAPSQDELNRLREELLQLQHSRAVETETVAGALRDASTAQATEELQRQLADFRRTWLTERQRLQDDIARARMEQQKRDTEEVHDLHEAYLKQFRERRSRVAMLVTVAGGLMAAVLVAASTAFYTSNIAQIVTLFAVGMLALVTATQLSVNGRSRTSDEYGALSTLDDLTRKARIEVSRRDRSPSPWSPDPYRRYAALVNWGDSDAAPWIRVLQTEPARFLRREIARAVCERDPASRESLAMMADPEIVGIVIEATGRERSSDELTAVLREIERQPPHLVSLAIFYELPAAPVSLLGEFLEELRRGVRVANYPEHSVTKLVKAYQSEDDRLLLEAIKQIPERELRRAAAELSPQEPRGLCSYYWLEATPELEEMYIFVRKAALLSALGLA